MIQIKKATPADLEEIEQLWNKVFGDEVAFIEEFYDSCCKIEQTIVLKEDGVLRTVGALLPVSLCLPDGSTASAAYLYGMATDPEAQGKGFGQIFLKYVDFYLEEHGFDCVVLVPEEPSLFRFFNMAGYQSAFSTHKIEVPADQVRKVVEGTSIRPAQPEEYQTIREELLENTFHVSYDLPMIAFQKSIAVETGGDLFLLDLPHGTGCAAVERWTTGEVWNGIAVKELLVPEGDLQAAISLIARETPGPRYFVRHPIFASGLTGAYGQPFGVIRWTNKELGARWEGQKRGHLGLALD